MTAWEGQRVREGERGKEKGKRKKEERKEEEKEKGKGKKGENNHVHAASKVR